MSMEYEFKHKGVHHCRAAVLLCMDFRFWPQTLDFLWRELKGNFDLIALPGAAKAINDDSEMAWKALEVTFGLHSAKKLVIVDHQDCGAYGGSAKLGEPEFEEEFHRHELHKAAEKIRRKYPQAQISLFYAHLDGKKEKIGFLAI